MAWMFCAPDGVGRDGGEHVRSARRPLPPRRRCSLSREFPHPEGSWPGRRYRRTCRAPRFALPSRAAPHEPAPPTLSRRSYKRHAQAGAEQSAQACRCLRVDGRSPPSGSRRKRELAFTSNPVLFIGAARFRVVEGEAPAEPVFFSPPTASAGSSHLRLGGSSTYGSAGGLAPPTYGLGGSLALPPAGTTLSPPTALPSAPADSPRRARNSRLQLTGASSMRKLCPRQETPRSDAIAWFISANCISASAKGRARSAGGRRQHLVRGRPSSWQYFAKSVQNRRSR